MSILTREQMYTIGNVAKTTSLIRELSRDGDEPVFSLHSPAPEGFISLQNLFVSHTVEDPTEIVFAEEVFGDILFWMNLRESPRLKPYLDKWREIAEMKRKQKAFTAIIKEVEGNGRGKMQAARFLIEEPWKGKTKAAKEQVSRTADKAFKSPGVSSDYNRLKEEGLIN